jgi:hypothetical protein
MAAHEQTPSAELEQALGHLKDQMDEVEKTITALQTTAPAPLSGCDISFYCNANAYPLTDIQGVGADSWSYFSNYNTCPYAGMVYADARGYTNSGSDFQSRNDTGSNVSVSAWIRTPGGPSCFSDAFSYVNVPDLGLYYSCYQSNYDCPVPVPPLRVYLYGPSHIYVYGYECVTEYWSASASGGTPPYSFSWSTSYGGGSGDSFSITFCGWGSNYTEYVNVSVTGYDSGGQSDSASMTTYVHYQGGDPCPMYLPICEPY